MASNGAFPTNQPDIPGDPGLPAGPSNVPSLGEMPSSSSVRLRDMLGQFKKGGFGYEWQGLDTVMALPAKFEQELAENISSSMDSIANSMEQYAKQNAPWTDNTGDARAGIKSVVIEDTRNFVWTIYLGHSVSYGFYLEHSNGGMYAIIEPTVQQFQSQLSGVLAVRSR